MTYTKDAEKNVQQLRSHAYNALILLGRGCWNRELFSTYYERVLMVFVVIISGEALISDILSVLLHQTT